MFQGVMQCAAIQCDREHTKPRHQNTDTYHVYSVLEGMKGWSVCVLCITYTVS